MVDGGEMQTDGWCREGITDGTLRMGISRRSNSTILETAEWAVVWRGSTVRNVSQDGMRGD
jgi:hypothetical protein